MTPAWLPTKWNAYRHRDSVPKESKQNSRERASHQQPSLTSSLPIKKWMFVPRHANSWLADFRQTRYNNLRPTHGHSACCCVVATLRMSLRVSWGMYRATIDQRKI